MASRSLGTLTMDLVARIGGFVDGLSRAEREARSRSQRIASNLKAIGAAATAAAGAMAAASFVIAKDMAAAGKEIDQLAKLSNAGTTEFQKYAFASKTVGVEQDKLADILKDVNDKVGDFLQTGGGPLADFFENIAPSIGVTAEQFANLSGPQALQLYVDSLDKANLSQAEMTFFMEAIASDSTLLLPLLQDQGKEYKALAAEADKFGTIMDEKLIKNSKEYVKQLDDMKAIQQGVKTQIASQLLPEMIKLNELFLDIAKNTDAARIVGEAIGKTIKVVASAAIIAAAALDTFVSRIQGVGRALSALKDLDFQRFDDEVFGTAKVGADQFGDAIERVKRLWGDLPEAVEASTEATKKNTGATNENSGALGRFNKETSSARDEVGEFIQRLEFAAATIGMTSQQVDLYRLALLGANDAQLAYAASLQNQVSESERATENQEYLNNLLNEHKTIITGVDAATMDYNETMAELNLLLQEGAISQDEFAAASQRAASRLEGNNKKTFDSFSDLAMDAAKKSQGALADFLFDPFKDGLAGMFDNFAMTLQRIVAEAAAAQIMEALLGDDDGGSGLLAGLFGGGKGGDGAMDEAAGEAGGGFIASMKGVFSSEGGGFLSGLGDAFSSGISGFGDIFSSLAGSIGGMFGGGGGAGGGGFFASLASGAMSLFGGGRANGGPVWPGAFFEVGEFNRPEMLKIGQKQFLIPGNSGSVEPMNGTMGRGTTQVFNVNTPNPDAFRLSERQIMRRAKQGLA